MHLKPQPQEEEFALLTRKFKMFVTKKKFSKNPYKKDDSKDFSNKRESDIICYECKKSGHIKSECPILKKANKRFKKKSKAMAATWSDSDDSSNDDDVEEVAVGFSLCLNTSNMFKIAAEIQQAQRNIHPGTYVAFI